MRRLILGAVLACCLAAFPLKASIVIVQPDPFYTSSTVLLDFSGVSDGSSAGSIGGGSTGLTVSFSVPLIRLTTGDTWGTWNSPPFTETDSPPVLYSNGASDVVFTLSSPEFVFGFEAQPDLSTVDLMTATFYGTGAPLSIPLNVSGNAGAVLFAFSSDTPITSVDLSNAAGDDFAIANVRLSPIALVSTPEPSLAPIMAIGIALAGIWRKHGPH